jgi:hypothetical protein
VPLSVQRNGNEASEPMKEAETDVTLAACLYKTLIHAGQNSS